VSQPMRHLLFARAIPPSCSVLLKQRVPIRSHTETNKKASAVRAVIIDPFRREVREADIENSLEEFQRIVGGGYIEFGVLINNRDVLYVNDFAFWEERFQIGQRHVFSGCGLITGGDSNGKGEGLTRAARVPLEEIRSVVRFAPKLAVTPAQR
jgi:hypothetical protein